MTTSSSSSSTSTKIVGKPLLNYDNSNAQTWNSSSNPFTSSFANQGLVKGPTPFNRSPIITPPTTTKGGREECRYVLMPNDLYVEVLSLENGGSVCRLVIGEEMEMKMEEDVRIQTVCLALLPQLLKKKRKGSDDDDGDDSSTSSSTSSSSSSSSEEEENGNKQEYVILAGCNNGYILEYAFTQIKNAPSGVNSTCVPRRIFTLPSFQINKNKNKEVSEVTGVVSHLTSPFRVTTPSFMEEDEEDDDEDEEEKKKRLGAVVYGLTRDVNACGYVNFLKFTLPPYSPPSDDDDDDEDSDDDDDEYSKENTASIQSLEDTTQLLTKFHCHKEDKRDDNDEDIAKKRKPSVQQKRDEIDVVLPPFALFSSQRNVVLDGGKNASEVYIGIVSSWSYHIYYERLDHHHHNNINNKSDDNHHHRLSFVNFHIDRRANLNAWITAFAMHPDANALADVAIGHLDGTMKIMVGLLNHIPCFVETKIKNSKQGNTRANESLKHPKDLVVNQSVHWHSRQVRTLCWMAGTAGGGNGGGGGGGARLFSAGEESVMQIWQLNRGIRKPINTFPRVGLGPIDSLTPDIYVHDGGVVLYCRDNTMRMIETHNFERKWIVRGLALMPADQDVDIYKVDPVSNSKTQMKFKNIMVHDPRTDLVLLTNVKGAPGFIHWFDPTIRRVVGTLEVSPFNRVSGKELTDVVPAPRVTHLAVSADGTTLVTVDATLTENVTLGSKREVWNERKYGGFYQDGSKTTKVPMALCNTIRFWSFAPAEESSENKKAKAKYARDDLAMPFDLVAAMASPHGKEGEVVALAMNGKGSTACTLSHEEGAFRIWGKRNDLTSKDTHSTPWKCTFKVSTPSGYANYDNEKVHSSVAFSSDGSVLAVSYGPFVTLWEHATASLLTTLTHDESLSFPISFIDGNNMDMMLLFGTSSVAVTPPFGENNMYCGKEGWFYGLGGLLDEDKNKGKDRPKVTCVTSVPKMGYSNKGGSEGSVNGVAIAMRTKNTTTVVVVDEATGDPLLTKDGSRPLSWTLKNLVTAMCSIPGTSSAPASRLLVTTNDHQMILLEVSDMGRDGKETVAITRYNSSTGSRYDSTTLTNAPRLNIQRGGGRQKSNMLDKKRKRLAYDVERSIQSKKQGNMSSFGAFSTSGGEPAAQLPSSDLPVLSGTFTTAFVGRNLRKKDAASEED